MAWYQAASGDVDEDVQLPELPPLEADEEPAADVDYSQLLASTTNLDDDDDDEPRELDFGIRIQTLEGEEEATDENGLDWDVSALLNLPDADAEDEADVLDVGALVSLKESEEDLSDDAEGPDEVLELDSDELPDLGIESSDDELETGEAFPEAEEAQEAWEQRALSQRSSMVLSDGPRLLSAGAGVWEVSSGRQLLGIETRDLCVLPRGIAVLDKSGRLWIDSDADGLLQQPVSGRVVQLVSASEAPGVLLALTLEGRLARFAGAGWTELDDAPAFSRLAHRSYPILGVSKSDRLCRSVDGGLSWHALDTEQPPIAWLRSHDLKLHCRGSLVALGAERSGLAVSTDGGLTFSEVPNLLGLCALSSGRDSHGLKLFAACYDATLDESRIYCVDPLELRSTWIGTIAAHEPDQDPRVRELLWQVGTGLLAAGDFGVVVLTPSDGLEPVV